MGGHFFPRRNIVRQIYTIYFVPLRELSVLFPSAASFFPTAVRLENSTVLPFLFSLNVEKGHGAMEQCNLLSDDYISFSRIIPILLVLGRIRLCVVNKCRTWCKIIPSWIPVSRSLLHLPDYVHFVLWFDRLYDMFTWSIMARVCFTCPTGCVLCILVCLDKLLGFRRMSEDYLLKIHPLEINNIILDENNFF